MANKHIHVPRGGGHIPTSSRTRCPCLEPFPLFICTLCDVFITSQQVSAFYVLLEKVNKLKEMVSGTLCKLIYSWFMCHRRMAIFIFGLDEAVWSVEFDGAGREGRPPSPARPCCLRRITDAASRTSIYFHQTMPHLRLPD